MGREGRILKDFQAPLPNLENYMCTRCTTDWKESQDPPSIPSLDQCQNSKENESDRHSCGILTSSSKPRIAFTCKTPWHIWVESQEEKKNLWIFLPLVLFRHDLPPNWSYFPTFSFPLVFFPHPFHILSFPSSQCVHRLECWNPFKSFSFMFFRSHLLTYHPYSAKCTFWAIEEHVEI